MHLGVLGGSFNPIHVGHLLVAQMALEQAGIDRILLVPAARPPHKRVSDLAPGLHRLRMARAAVEGLERVTVSDMEFQRSGPSYTVDTLRELKRRHPGTRLTLLIGQDTLRELDGWKEPARLKALASLAVYRRPGCRPAGRRVRWVEGPRLDISGRQIRERRRHGLSIRFWVPLPVEKYIVRHGLYR